MNERSLKVTNASKENLACSCAGAVGAVQEVGQDAGACQGQRTNIGATRGVGEAAADDHARGAAIDGDIGAEIQPRLMVCKLAVLLASPVRRVTGLPYKPKAPAAGPNARLVADSSKLVMSLVLVTRVFTSKYRRSIPVRFSLPQLAASLQSLSVGLPPVQVPAGAPVIWRSMELLPVLFTRLAVYPAGRVPQTGITD